MTNQETINIIKCAIAEVEWNYPLDYAIAFETAIEALTNQEQKTQKILKCDNCFNYPKCYEGEKDERCTEFDRVYRILAEGGKENDT